VRGVFQLCEPDGWGRWLPRGRLLEGTYDQAIKVPRAPILASAQSTARMRSVEARPCARRRSKAASPRLTPCRAVLTTASALAQECERRNEQRRRGQRLKVLPGTGALTPCCEAPR